VSPAQAPAAAARCRQAAARGVAYGGREGFRAETTRPRDGPETPNSANAACDAVRGDCSRQSRTSSTLATVLASQRSSCFRGKNSHAPVTVDARRPRHVRSLCRRSPSQSGNYARCVFGGRVRKRLVRETRSRAAPNRVSRWLTRPLAVAWVRAVVATLTDWKCC